MYKQMKLDYNTLFPYIDDETLKIQYDYYLYGLNKLNSLVDNDNEIKDLIINIDKYPLLKRDDILYYAGMVLNHEMYLNNMNLNNKKPSGKLEKEIIKQYGSFDNFKKEFIEATSYLVGSGYTFLVTDENGKLNIINTSNYENPYYYGLIPLLTIDLWEHAYFLKYKTNRQEYILNFFKILDFTKANEIYEKETK